MRAKTTAHSIFSKFTDPSKGLKFQASAVPNQHFYSNKTQKQRTPLQNKKKGKGKRKIYLHFLAVRNKTKHSNKKKHWDWEWNKMAAHLYFFFPFFPFFYGKFVGYFWENWQWPELREPFFLWAGGDDRCLSQRSELIWRICELTFLGFFFKKIKIWTFFF